MITSAQARQVPGQNMVFYRHAQIGPIHTSGHLRRENSGYALHGLSYLGTPLTVSGQSLKEGPTNVLGLGQNLLGHYRSAWNYRKQTVVLLKP